MAEGPGGFAQLFWGASKRPDEETAQTVIAHTVRCLDAFTRGEVTNDAGQAITLMGLLATLGIEENLVYGSPELARGELFDERALVFSIGVLVFERLTERHPFGTSDNVRIARIRKGEMGSGVNYFPSVDPKLRAILMRAMGPFPEERYESVAQLREELIAFCGQDAIDGPKVAEETKAVLDELAQQEDADSTVETIPDGKATAKEPTAVVASSSMEGMDDETMPWLPPADVPVDEAVLSSGALLKKSAEETIASVIVEEEGSSTSQLHPAVYVLLGAALATVIFVAITLLKSDGSKDDATDKKRVEKRVPQKSSTSASVAVDNSQESKAAHRDKNAAVNKNAAGRDSINDSVGDSKQDTPKTVAKGDTPKDAAKRVADVIRTCGIAKNGSSIRVAVFAKAEGKVVRAFTAGKSAKGGVGKCVRKELRGFELGFSLKKDDYVEWQFQIYPDHENTKLTRPKYLRGE